MTPLASEFIGTMMLILLGNGVCANVNLTQSKGNGSGWIVIATGWGLAVAFAVYLTNSASGGHLNPAVTIALMAKGDFPLLDGLGYMGMQLAGAMAGAILVWLAYLPHWNVTKDPAAIHGSFCTSPAIRSPIANVICEAIGTFALMLGVLAILTPENLQPKSGLKEAAAPALVGMTVWLIGLSLGGPTGYAINPARDLGPRIIHAILPMQNKGDSDWGYAWVPIIGPIIGSLAAAGFYSLFWT